MPEGRVLNRREQHKRVTRAALEEATIQELRHEVAVFVAERRGVSPTHPYPLLVSAAASTAWDVALQSWATGHPGTLAELRKSVFDQLSGGISPIVT